MFRPCSALRPATLVLLLAAAAGAHASEPLPASLVIVEPDVELTVARADPALPSATRSEAFAHAWPTAAASALGRPGPAIAWTPPGDIRHDAPLGQVLATQEAVATALLEHDEPPRPLSIGPDAARLAEATGATHALFARIRAAPRRGTAVAMLVDLRTGVVLRHRTLDDVDSGTAPATLATRVSRKLLGDWPGAPAIAAPAPSREAAATPADDVARVAARLERRLRRHPRRVDDPELEARLRNVACRLDEDACASPRPIVLAEPGVYAAMLPGGALVVHTGLLLRLRDEAELAFVLAHERAHERAGDVRARLAAGRDAARGEWARAQETAADRDAFARMTAAGYDPAAAIDLWARLADEERADAAAAVPGSHPPAAQRLAAARAAALGAVGGDRGADRWEALVAPRREGWQRDESGSGPVGNGRSPAPSDGRPLEDARSAAMPATGGATTRPRTRRVLGVRLSTNLPWRQRPGIGTVTWTVDGTPLNRLLIVSGVARGDALLRDAAGSAPTWDGGGADGTTALIAAALRRGGWIDVRAFDDRPHDFGGVPGRRAELALADAGGLHYRGTLAHAVRDGRLTWLVWLAPEGFFHDRDAAAVAAMLDGARFGR